MTAELSPYGKRDFSGPLYSYIDPQKNCLVRGLNLKYSKKFTASKEYSDSI